jgi:cytochrome c peroxidase
MRGRVCTLMLLTCAACGSGSQAPPPPPTHQPTPIVSDEARAKLVPLSPAELPPPPADVTNKYADDAAAAHLGQELFFDPSFSGRLLDADDDGRVGSLGKVGQTGAVACASCHVAKTEFDDTRSPGGTISLAAGWGRRRAPSLLDVGQAKLVMWGGRRDAIWNQPFGVIESPLEWNSSRLYVAEQLAAKYRTEYNAVFQTTMPAFDDATQFPQLSADQAGCTPVGVLSPTCSGTTHGMPGDHAEYDGLGTTAQDEVTRAVVNMGKALAAYERRLSCGPSRFDQFMHGDASALDASEQRGAVLFVEKGGCVTCHSGPFLSDQQFHDVSLSPKQVVFAAPADLDDEGAKVDVAAAIVDPLNTLGPYSDGSDGRLPKQVTPAMQNAFRTPNLRCVSHRPSFMHTGQLSTLEAVVAFFNRGGDVPPPGTQGSNEIKPLGLTADEEQDLVHFLQALDGPGPDPSLLGPP